MIEAIFHLASKLILWSGHHELVSITLRGRAYEQLAGRLWDGESKERPGHHEYTINTPAGPVIIKRAREPRSGMEIRSLDDVAASVEAMRDVLDALRDWHELKEHATARKLLNATAKWARAGYPGSESTSPAGSSS